MKIFIRLVVLFLAAALTASLAGCGPVQCDDDPDDDCLRVLSWETA